jgi:hypothetical protein
MVSKYIVVFNFGAPEFPSVVLFAGRLRVFLCACFSVRSIDNANPRHVRCIINAINARHDGVINHDNDLCTDAKIARFVSANLRMICSCIRHAIAQCGRSRVA